MVLKFRKAWVPILIAGLLTSSGLSAMAADKALDIAQDDATRAQALPARVTVGFERLRLPGDERVGLLGASYVVELAPGWWLGPAKSWERPMSWVSRNISFIRVSSD